MANDKTVKTIDFKVKHLGEHERRLRFIGSSETPDRDGDVISSSGWELENYKKNPVFLWAHDYSIPPIGRALNVKVVGKELHFDIEFPEKGIHALADTVFGLYQGGFLNATSVGFVGKEAVKRDDDAVKDLPEWRKGVKFTKQELLELSAVPVPSNPTALLQAKAKGYIPNGFTKYFELDTDDGIQELLDMDSFKPKEYDIEELIDIDSFRKPDENVYLDMPIEEVKSAVSIAVEAAVKKATRGSRL